MVGVSLCHCKDVSPNAFSTECSGTSPSPGVSVSLLLVLSSAIEGEERTEVEVVSVSESLGKRSISLTGPTLTVKDRTVLGTLLVNVEATCVLFVWPPDGLWSAEELFGSVILAEDEEWSEGGE